ncbi:MAG: hypothetical protein AAB840_01360 [Patescibacteria group bacterium]
MKSLELSGKVVFVILGLLIVFGFSILLLQYANSANVVSPGLSKDYVKLGLVESGDIIEILANDNYPVFCVVIRNVRPLGDSNNCYEMMLDYPPNLIPEIQWTGFGNRGLGMVCAERVVVYRRLDPNGLADWKYASQRYILQYAKPRE